MVRDLHKDRGEMSSQYNVLGIRVGLAFHPGVAVINFISGERLCGGICRVPCTNKADAFTAGDCQPPQLLPPRWEGMIKRNKSGV